MEDQPQIGKNLVGWFLVAMAAVLVGATLSGAASVLGLTYFPGDRRGEWAPVVVPLLAVLSLPLGLLGVRILLRSAHQPWQIAVVAVLLASTATFCLSRQFGYAAA